MSQATSWHFLIPLLLPTNRFGLREAGILHSNLEELNKELDKVLLVFRGLIVEDSTLQLVNSRNVLDFQDLERCVLSYVPTHRIVSVGYLLVKLQREMMGFKLKSLILILKSAVNSTDLKRFL